MNQTGHLPALIPKQLPLLSLSHHRRDREEAEASRKTQNLIHTHIHGITYAKQIWSCKMNTIKYGFTQTNMKYVYPALSSSSRRTLSSLYPCLPLLCRFSRCCRLSFFPFADLMYSRDPLSHTSERHEWPEKKEESRGERCYSYLTRKRTERRNERKRRRRRTAALLDETVNTAASTAESGLYHMQRPGRDGGGIRSKRPHPTQQSIYINISTVM